LPIMTTLYAYICINKYKNISSIDYFIKNVDSLGRAREKNKAFLKNFCRI